MPQRYQHTPVLLDEVVHYLQPKSNQDFIDGTLGGGGHSLAILDRNGPKGRVLGIDLDPTAREAVKETLKKHKIKKNRLVIAPGNFKDIKEIAYEYSFLKASGILLDLGISSGQLQDHVRGFSFISTGTLDMRFGPDAGIYTASELLNTLPEQALTDIFKNYGEEPLARPIAKKIIEARKEELITRPEQLTSIISSIYKRNFKAKSKIHPATRVFQALRIAVNGELDNLQKTLPDALSLLRLGGRLVVISYHSLEDRIVKHFFQQESKDCICPPERPTCQCGHKASLRIITKKPIGPALTEMAENHRSRSAKLRVAERI
jgi:16S rRNA (cytosine1402-N4)-methyltransferase